MTTSVTRSFWLLLLLLASTVSDCIVYISYGWYPLLLWHLIRHSFQSDRLKQAPTWILPLDSLWPFSGTFSLSPDSSGKYLRRALRGLSSLWLGSSVYDIWSACLLPARFQRGARRWRGKDLSARVKFCSFALRGGLKMVAASPEWWNITWSRILQGLNVSEIQLNEETLPPRSEMAMALEWSTSHCKEHHCYIIIFDVCYIGQNLCMLDCVAYARVYRTHGRGVRCDVVLLEANPQQRPSRNSCFRSLLFLCLLP